MRSIRALSISAILLGVVLSAPQSAAIAADEPEASSRRGIAVLASSIGSDYSPEQLADLVQRYAFSPVVIDWAWITAHWDRTDFEAVNRFVDLMDSRHVPVAAMYRPRFLDHPTVPTQVDRTGEPAASHGYSICFSSREARRWGIAWGTRILRQCPRIGEIIIYNPLNQCQCPTCRKAAQDNPYAAHDAVWQFMSEAKRTWQAQKPSVKLGVVYVNDTEFWRRGSQVVDVAHPFLFLTDDADMLRGAREAQAVRDLLPGKTGACLAKITWGPGDRVSSDRLAEFDTLAGLARLPYVFWTAETLFDPQLYDQEAVDDLLVSNQLTAPNDQSPPPSVDRAVAAQQTAGAQSSDRRYSPDEIRDTPAEVFLERLARPEPGYWRFAALNALAQKAKESDPPAKAQILSATIAVMKDTSRPLDQRWQCCYVISGSLYEPGVPDLIDVLLHDESEIVRSVAAEALGDLDRNAKSAAAHDALLEAARHEPSARVREVLARHLGTLPSTSSSFAGVTNPPGGYHRGDLMYTAEQTRTLSPEALLERMVDPEKDYNQFAALNALIEKVKEADPAARGAIMSPVIAAMHDRSRLPYLRWQCCKVIGDSHYEPGVPDLIDAFLHDESPIVRAVAEEVLGQFPDSPAAREALHAAGGPVAPPSGRTPPARRRVTPAAATPVEELSPTGPPQPPPGPAWPVAEPLPWPFPGNQEDQNIFNNYQQATDIYIHCALDFIHPAGTPVTAVDSGYVAAIDTNYPQWITHHFFIVTPKRGGSEGWCYTHLDPRTYTFREGGFIRRGQRLGSLVDFSVGDQPGVSHLHLHYVRFTRDASGKTQVHSLLDPLYFFDWQDTEPPVFRPLRFVSEDMTREFEADSSGVVTVSGRVEVLAAVTDGAYPGHLGNLGVPVVMTSISDGVHTAQALVVDHRGDVGDETKVKPLYLSYDERKAFLDPGSFPRYQMLRVTKTDGDGWITPADAGRCWDTTAVDRDGNPLWPDGRYTVNVYAWDIAANRAAVGAIVQVRNR